MLPEISQISDIVPSRYLAMTADIFFNVYEFIIKNIIRYTQEQSSAGGAAAAGSDLSIFGGHDSVRSRDV